MLAGALVDGGYQRSTPGSLQAQGTIVDFERGHSRQVYIDTLWFNHRWVIGGILVGLAIVSRALAGTGLKLN
jgi:hypothetical protein